MATAGRERSLESTIDVSRCGLDFFWCDEISQRLSKPGQVHMTTPSGCHQVSALAGRICAASTTGDANSRVEDTWEHSLAKHELKLHLRAKNTSLAFYDFGPRQPFAHDCCRKRGKSLSRLIPAFRLYPFICSRFVAKRYHRLVYSYCTQASSNKEDLLFAILPSAYLSDKQSRTTRRV